MNNQHKSLLLEKRRLNKVLDEIERKQDQLKESNSGLKKGIIKLRKDFWDDVKVNIDEPDDIIETQASIKQQAELLSEKERSHGHQYNQLKTLERLHDSPYFGRIDFQEDKEQEIEPIYIGLASLMDKTGENFLVYDWRAPISSMYYDYTLGKAIYQTMDGPIQGEISLKRQFMIKNGEMEGMFDTGLTIGDHLLQKMLGSHSSTKMKNIVSTIQQEQNRIIRDEKSKLLIVQGVAGSGKTSAVLQRIAYLLYANRKTLQAGNMLLFSPNPLFNSYVSTVLPELGEENMRQTTYMEYAKSRLGDYFHLEDSFEQMETILTTIDNEIRIEAIQYKSSLAFKQLIDNYIEVLAQRGLQFHDITFRERTIVPAEKIKQYFYGLDVSISIPNRLEIVAEWLIEKIEVQEHHEQDEDWVTEEVELLDKEDYMEAYHEAQRIQQDETDTFDDIDQEWEILSENVVSEHFQPIKDIIRNLEFMDVQSTYRPLYEGGSGISLENQPKNWKTICKMTLKSLDRNELAWEEVTAYLYFLDQLQGKKSYTHIQHVFIDEAQDYSPFQFAYLAGIFPNSQMTILGDINQAIYMHSLDSTSVLDSRTTDNQKKIMLMRSYRSTQQIVEFTKQLIQGGKQIEPFNRDGEKPTLTMAENKQELNQKVLDRIHALQTAGQQTIAIICKTMAESRIAYKHLKSQINVQLMDQETYTFHKGLLILPAYLAKGIEFDAVIIYNTSAYNKESERNLFYTACTRAMHELHMFTTAKENVFIADASPETYH